MRPFILPLFLSVLSTSAELFVPKTDSNRPGIGSTPEALRVSELAGQHPNASTLISFKRSYNNTPETWTWRVNISDIAVPDTLDDLGNPSATFSKKLHVANTQFQLDWPGNKNTFQAFLADRNMRVELVSMIRHLPSNVTDKYDLQKDGKDGSCVNVLGQSCVDDITRQSSEYLSTMNWQNRLACQDTLLTKPISGSHDVLDGFAFEPKENSSDSSTLHAGKTLWFHTSKNYTEGNATELEYKKSAVHILVMSFKRKNIYGDYIADQAEPSLLCAMAQKRKGDVDVNKSAAISLRLPSFAVFVTAMLGATLVLW